MEGRAEDAERKLHETEVRLQEMGMALLVAVTQRLRGELLSGTEGAGLLAASDSFLRGEGVRNTDAMIRTFAPVRGFVSP